MRERPRKIAAEVVASVRHRGHPGKAILIRSGPRAAAIASTIARLSDRPLHRVDLAAVSSKYVGETEKNLEIVFEKARRSGALLFLDEADALFARSEAGDAHDRDAGLVTVLATMIQRFDGAVIVAGSDLLANARGFRDALRVEIDLPDLEQQTDVEIVRENLQAIQAIYFAYMLEESRAFAVVDRIVSLFASGMLPIGAGASREWLATTWLAHQARLSERERRTVYSRVFGAPGGDPGVTPNREFAQLWLRFVSALSASAGRDLAVNLSEHGYGMALFVARELGAQAKGAIALLSDPEVSAAFGAREMWQVIDQVAANYLGGARNAHRYAAMARSGSTIIDWLARNADALNKRHAPAGDAGLTEASEQWLAAKGAGDTGCDPEHELG